MVYFKINSSSTPHSTSYSPSYMLITYHMYIDCIMSHITLIDIKYYYNYIILILILCAVPDTAVWYWTRI